MTLPPIRDITLNLVFTAAVPFGTSAISLTTFSWASCRPHARQARFII
jgi:hypothetical protein